MSLSPAPQHQRLARLAEETSAIPEWLGVAFVCVCLCNVLARVHPCDTSAIKTQSCAITTHILMLPVIDV